MSYLHRFHECQKIADSRRTVVLRENNSEYRADNPTLQQVAVFRVDGCILEDKDGKKCDYLLLADQNLHFIELKGRNLEDAILQIKNTVQVLMPHLSPEVTAAFAKVALRKTPPKAARASLTQWAALRTLMKTYQGDAFKQNSPFQDTL